jgi:hypothetical protein
VVFNFTLGPPKTRCLHGDKYMNKKMAINPNYSTVSLTAPQQQDLKYWEVYIQNSVFG